MSVFFVGVRIWLSTIVLNVLLNFYVIFFDVGEGLLGLFLLLLFGIVFAFPVLPLIILLVKVSARLPYPPLPRIVWLGTCFSGLIVLFFWLLGILPIAPHLDTLSLTSIVAMTLSLYFYTKSLKAYYNSEAATRKTGTPFM